MAGDILAMTFVFDAFAFICVHVRTHVIVLILFS